MKLSPTIKSTMKSIFQSLPAKSFRLGHNFKITLLCGLMTLLVLHGAVGRTTETKPEVTARAIEEPEVEQKVDYWDPSVPFVLGPKISNWDDQRELWNQAHPCANTTRSGKARVLLISGSQPKPCATPMGGFQLLKSLKNKVM